MKIKNIGFFQQNKEQMWGNLVICPTLIIGQPGQYELAVSQELVSSWSAVSKQLVSS